MCAFSQSHAGRFIYICAGGTRNALNGLICSLTSRSIRWQSRTCKEYNINYIHVNPIAHSPLWPLIAIPELRSSTLTGPGSLFSLVALLSFHMLPIIGRVIYCIFASADRDTHHSAVFAGCAEQWFFQVHVVIRSREHHRARQQALCQTAGRAHKCALFAAWLCVCALSKWDFIQPLCVHWTRIFKKRKIVGFGTRAAFWIVSELCSHTLTVLNNIRAELRLPNSVWILN